MSGFDAFDDIFAGVPESAPPETANTRQSEKRPAKQVGFVDGVEESELSSASEGSIDSTSTCSDDSLDNSAAKGFVISALPFSCSVLQPRQRTNRNHKK